MPVSLPAPAAQPRSDPGTSGSPAPAASVPNEWDFYSEKNDDQDKPGASKQIAENRTTAKPADLPGPSPALTPVEREEPPLTHVRAPVPAPTPALRYAKASIILQVAALRHESDALTMADLLQKKHFPAFVAAPTGGVALYHVQVGPYADERSADAAKAALDRDGFKAILKH
jgi:cell division septation protein DedD